jgi:hypothetical protein
VIETDVIVIGIVIGIGIVKESGPETGRTDEIAACLLGEREEIVVEAVDNPAKSIQWLYTKHNYYQGLLMNWRYQHRYLSQ